MNIILFNGPPGCGKDTAASHLYNSRWALPGTWRFDRMSMPNKRAFAGTVGAEVNEFGIVANGWEQQKDQPDSLLNGKSYRQWQIDFSESFMKPLYGGDVFARLFAARHEHRADDRRYTILVPDCGFPVEVLGIRKAFPSAGILLFRIYRPGHDFSFDSRGYIEPTPEMGLSVIDVQNDRTRVQFEAEIITHVLAYFGASK